MFDYLIKAHCITPLSCQKSIYLMNTIFKHENRLLIHLLMCKYYANVNHLCLGTFYNMNQLGKRPILLFVATMLEYIQPQCKLIAFTNNYSNIVPLESKISRPLFTHFYFTSI